MMLRWLIILICMLQVMPAFARMYQWNDPATGTTQFSGTPPAWYRSVDDGPRVFVFERGRIIDDTEVAVSEERRIALRQEAFMKTGQDSQEARSLAERAERLRLTLERPQLLEQFSETWSQVEAEAGLFTDQETRDRLPDAWQESAARDQLGDLSPQQIEQLRSLLSEWEAERARSLRHMLMSDEDLPSSQEQGPVQLPEDVPAR